MSERLKSFILSASDKYSIYKPTENTYDIAYKVLEMYEDKIKLSQDEETLLKSAFSLILQIQEELEEIFSHSPEPLNSTIIIKLLEKSAGDWDTLKEINHNVGRYSEAVEEYEMDDISQNQFESFRLEPINM